MTPQISAVIITKNEEKNIDRCLKSLIGVVDEIIVVDSFSTDRTEEICRKYEARFLKKEFVDFSSSKNYGNDEALYPFIFSIDADEELSEELKQSIQSAKSDLKADGYHLNRKTNYCGRWINYSGWYPDTKLRLFRKSKSQWVGTIHETLELNSDNIKFLKGDLLHYSFPSIKYHAKKIDLFTDMAAKRMFDRQKKVTILKLFVSPMFEFFKKYILKRGFLDGYQGFVIAVMSAYHKFYKYAKLKELWINKEPLSDKK